MAPAIWPLLYGPKALLPRHASLTLPGFVAQVNPHYMTLFSQLARRNFSRVWFSADTMERRAMWSRQLTCASSPENTAGLPHCYPVAASGCLLALLHNHGPLLSHPCHSMPHCGISCTMHVRHGLDLTLG